MKKYDWNFGFESFLDRKEESKVFFDVEAGMGRPQRLYPETKEEFRELWEKRVRFPLNPGLGEVWPSRKAREIGQSMSEPEAE